MLGLFSAPQRNGFGAAKGEWKAAKRTNAERVMLIAIQFTNSVIEALGGKEKLAGRDIVITMIPAEPIPWFQVRKK